MQAHRGNAITKNPTIYVSSIKQFWQTATARTLDNGEIELTATIDGTVKTVTEASVRRHLQLADADGISSLPTLGTVGPVVQGEGSTHPVESHHIPTSAPSTSQPPISPTSRRTTRQESVVPQPRSLTQTPLQYDTTRINGFLYNIVKESRELERQTDKQTTANNMVLLILDLSRSTSITTASINITTAEPVTIASAPITTADVSISTAEPSTPPTTTTTPNLIEDEDLAIAQTLMKMKSEKSKAKGLTMQEPTESGTRRLQAELDEEARLEREREEEASKAANTAEWDDVQAMIDSDYELATKL
ncbi:hypothetical protein Tco_0846059 [Tanacetum coccineum]